MRKLLLIRPYSKIRMPAPPIGLLYLSAYLKNKINIEVKLIDARRYKHNLDEIFHQINLFNPDFIGITGYEIEKYEIRELAENIRNRKINAGIILGGAIANSIGDYFLKNNLVDCLVLGEGEIALKEIVEGKAWEKISNLSYLKDGHIKTNRIEFIENLDSIPFPDWSIIKIEDYFGLYGYPFRAKRRYFEIVTSRGCPYNCSFCHNYFGKKFRFRSPENVIEEIKFLINHYQIEEIEVDDDIFNYNINRAKRILKGISRFKRTIKISFSNGLLINNIDDEFIALMKNSGVYRVCFGIETGSEKIQRAIKKNLNLSKAKSIIRKITAKGLSVGGFFILGLPGETQEDINKTIEFASNSSLHTAGFSYLTPYKGSPLYKNHYTMLKDKKDIDYGSLTMNLSNISNHRLRLSRKKAFLKFYINPLRLIKLINVTPNKSVFIKGGYEVIKILFSGIGGY